MIPFLITYECIDHNLKKKKKISKFVLTGFDFKCFKLISEDKEKCMKFKASEKKKNPGKRKAEDELSKKKKGEKYNSAVTLQFSNNIE
jgi:hypothetical protein